MITQGKMFDDSLFYVEGKKLLINDQQLDIYEPLKVTIPPWQPTINLQPLSSVKVCYFDLETEDRDPYYHKIMMIGMLLSNGKVLILDWTQYTEREMIECFFYQLSQLKPDVLVGHNVWMFDINFLIVRCQILGINHPFGNPRQKVFRTAYHNGSPAVFNQYFLRYSGQQVSIIDTYLQVLSKDYSERRLTSYSLKKIPIQWGLRAESTRVELTHNQIKECYENNNVELITDYLIDDLKDTELLFNRLFPEIYYQKLFLPDWSLQSLATSGNGSKWNSILCNHYGYEPKPDIKYDFDGGFTLATAGVFKNVEKLDVESLYPSLMDRYLIYSRKDYQMHQLGVLKYAKIERLRLKKLPDAESQAMQSALKIFINSSYGFLGTAGIPFNDMRAGLLVTAYGQKIVKLMYQGLLNAGVTPIETDTDGIFYALGYKDGGEVYKYLQSLMPMGIVLDREKLGTDGKHQADLLYIPPIDEKKKKENEDTDGLKKNYLIISGDKIIAKGIYKKRNFEKLRKNFQPEFLRLYNKDPELAFKYYRDLMDTIKSGSLDLELIKIRRKAAITEKEVRKLGLVDNDGYCEFYYGLHLKVLKKSTKWESIKVNTGDYSIQYYCEMIENQFNELKRFL